MTSSHQQERRDAVKREEVLMEPMIRFRSDPINWVREIYLFVKGQDWRAYDNVIGQPCFYRGYTAKMKSSVMTSPLLCAHLERLVDTRLAKEVEEGLLDGNCSTSTSDRAQRRVAMLKSLEEYAAKIVDNMICKMESRINIRTAYYWCTQLLTRVYSGVYVSQKEVIRLRQVAAQAAAQKKPIIFLPRHSSHIDYVALQLICFRLGITLPVVVAGDNLNFPVIGPFLQSAGAMWIRRSFDGDGLYRTLVQAYLDSMMQQGYNLECFIEGGRSRTGKLLQPKFGFLRFVIDSVLAGRTEDAYICPVSIQYDKVIEVDGYVNEMLGRPKKKENLADSLSSLSLLGLNMGRVDCRFHEPWSLREFMDEQLLRITAEQDSKSGSATTTSRLLRTLGYKVLADINDVAVVMPTALIGTVLLTLRGRGVGKAELARRVDWLCGKIARNGGNIADFHGTPTTVICERALAVLGSSLVGKVEGLAEETYFAADRFQLSFYRNMVIHLFISEALISLALYTKVKQGGGFRQQAVPIGDLGKQVLYLSQLLRGEFIFKTGQGIQANFEIALKRLIDDEVLEISPGIEQEKSIGLSEKERRTGRESYDFYCFLLWPFIDAAWLGAVSLLCLVPPRGSSTLQINSKTAQGTAQRLGRTLYHQGDLSYFEAINTEAIRNAYARFEEEGIIMTTQGKTATLCISPDWMPLRASDSSLQAEGRLWDFIGKIAEHRREGKNRRDGATVSTRVLQLAEKLNAELVSQLQPSDSVETLGPVSHLRKERRSKL